MPMIIRRKIGLFERPVPGDQLLFYSKPCQNGGDFSAYQLPPVNMAALDMILIGH